MRRFSFIALLLLLAGCTGGGPPPAEEILRQLAANAAAKSDAEAVPATPEDAAAIQHAAAEIDDHVRRQKEAASAVSRTAKTDYEVAVTAPRSMAGTWRMVTPTSFHIQSGQQDQYGQVHNYLCRVDQKGQSLKGSCLPRAELSGRIRDGEVRLAWGSKLISADIKGWLVTPTDFAGVLSIGAMGFDLMGKGIPLYLTKIPASVPVSKEVDDLAGRVIADLSASDFSGDRYSAETRSALSAEPPLSRSDIKALGSVRERLYLGSVESHGDGPGAMEIYDVEFERGWKLCGFSRSGDGRVDHIDCK